MIDVVSNRVNSAVELNQAIPTTCLMIGRLPDLREVRDFNYVSRLTREDHKVRMFNAQEGWQNSDGRDGNLRPRVMRFLALFLLYYRSLPFVQSIHGSLEIASVQLIPRAHRLTVGICRRLRAWWGPIHRLMFGPCRRHCARLWRRRHLGPMAR